MNEFRPCPKPSHKRRVPKQKDRSRFSEKIIKEIFERDDFRCVRCGTYKDLESVSHHITFRSQGGLGTKRNGATTCRSCHALAHSDKEIRKWFEQWREETLDQYGNKRR